MAPSSPLVTATMLVRDRAELLESAARSVLAQDGVELELVIVDDGSVDDTRAVAERLAAADPRVRVVANDTSRGIPAARNQALVAARGRYVAICDSDDLARPGRFARQVELLEANPKLVGVGARFAAFPGDDVAAGVEPGWHWGLRDARLPFLFPTGTFRAEALRAIDGFDEGYALAEDLHLCYRLAAAGGRFAMVDEVLLDYRVHPGSVTQRRAVAREWHNLRAQLTGLWLMRGGFRPRGYAVLAQSALRTLAAVIGVRK